MDRTMYNRGVMDLLVGIICGAIMHFSMTAYIVKRPERSDSGVRAQRGATGRSEFCLKIFTFLKEPF